MSAPNDIGAHSTASSTGSSSTTAPSTAPSTTAASKNNWRSWAALACAVWFVALGSAWTYGMALVLGYPVAVLGLVLWAKGRGANPTGLLPRVTAALLAVGLVASLVTLLLVR